MASEEMVKSATDGVSDLQTDVDEPPVTAHMVSATPEVMRKRQGPPMSHTEHAQVLEQKLTALYASMDTDGDGRLSGAEIKAKLDADDDIEELMALAGKSMNNIDQQLDDNRDGMVSLAEFLDMLTKQGFEYTFDWLVEQVVFQKQSVEHRRLNVLAIEEGYDASTVRADAEKCNATFNDVTQRWERDLGDVLPVWALVFTMGKDSDGNVTDKVTHETVEVVQRMWELDLTVDVRRTIDDGEVIVLVGIPYVIMQREAEEMAMKLRLKDTRGTLEYSVEFHDRFADYVRHPTRKGTGEIFKDREKGAEPDNFLEKPYASVFNSTHQQQAVLHRITSNGMDLDFRMQLMPLETLMRRMRRLLNNRRPVRAFQLKELLTAAGGFRENCDTIMGDNVDILAEQVLADPFMTLFPAEQCKEDGNQKEQEAYKQMQIVKSHLRNHRYPPGAPGSQLEINHQRFPDGLPPIEYEHVEQLLVTLDGFCFPEVLEKVDKKTGEIKVEGKPAGPGADEQYTESLQLFFPLHNQEELSWLRNRWGSWNQLWVFNITAKEVEGGYTPCWNIMDDAGNGFQHTPDTPYIIPTVVFGCLYQPLDEIRDYFGDDNAIYFSWLVTYTKALGVAGIFGAVTMIFQFWKPEMMIPTDEQIDGVDGNPLTLMYSVFMSIWSVVFLSVWRRKEAEHSFLWGSEGFEDSEPPRPQFKGKLVVNPETGREDLVISNYPLLLLKKCFSYAVIFLCMLVTVTLAFQAMALKNYAPRACQPGEDSVVTHIYLGCGADPSPPGENIKVQIQLLPGDERFDSECCYDMEDLCYVDNGCGEPIEVNDKKKGKFAEGANGEPGAACPPPDGSSYASNQTTVEEFCGPRQSVVFQSLSAYYKLYYKLLSATCNLIVIQGAGFIYEAIAEKLNDMENFRTQTEHSDGLIAKNFLFQFVNNYFVLFYIAYARHIQVGETPGKHCPSSCLPEIQIQMLVVFTAKTFGLQAVELYKPFIQKHIKVVMEMKHMKSIVAATEQSLGAASALATEAANKTAQMALSEEALEEIGLSENDVEEARIREQRLIAKRAARPEAVGVPVAEGETRVMCEYEQQTHMVNYEDNGTFDDFNEMAIQYLSYSVPTRHLQSDTSPQKLPTGIRPFNFDRFKTGFTHSHWVPTSRYGYISLFSPSFPVAPLLAFINNVTEIRGDAWKLCKGYQRPMAGQAEDIGSWFAVLNLLGFVAVLTNATMIAFVGSQLAETDWEKEGITHRTETARMWTYAAIVEHSVMLTRVCILVFFPVHPDWIRDARDVLRFRVNDMKKLSRARREGLAEEYSNVVSPRLDGSVNESTRKSNALKSRTFKHADVDGDRQLTREEFIQAFGKDAVGFEDIDFNHDGRVDSKEWSRGTGVKMRKNRGQKSQVLKS